MGAVNTDDFFYKGVSSDNEQAYIAGFMNSLACLAENAIEVLHENNIEVPSARFKELLAFDDENFIDSFNCRMRQPTKYLDPTLSTKEANLISHDDFYLVAAAKVIVWTREAQLIFKDIEGMGMDAVGTKSAIIGLAHHVGLIDRATNALDFSDVLASAKASKSARHPRKRHPLRDLVEESYRQQVKDLGSNAKLPKYMDVINALSSKPDVDVKVDRASKTVEYGDSKPTAFRTIQEWLSELKEKRG